MPNLSLKLLLALLLAGLFLVFGSIVTTLNTRATTRQLERNVGQTLQNLAFEMADKLDRGMFERSRDLDILATLDEFQSAGDAGEQERRALLEKLQETFPAYAWIGFTNPQGTVLTSTGGLLEGADVGQRPWFQGALKGPFAGDVHEAKLLAALLPAVDSEPLRFVDVATPIRNAQGQLTGVLGAHLSWNWTKEVRESLLQPLQDRERLDLFIIDRDGLILLGPPSLQGQHLHLSTLDRHPVTGYGVERWPDGRSYVTGVSRSRGYRTYKGLEWRVVVRQDTDVAYAPVVAYRRAAIATDVALSALFALVGLVTAVLIARPLHRLTAAARSIEAGSIEVDVPATAAYREAAHLSRALRQLIGKLKQNEWELESRVEERTRALDARTAEAEALSALSNLSTENLEPLDMAGRIAPVIASVCQLDWIELTVVAAGGTTTAPLYVRANLDPLPEIPAHGAAELGLPQAALLQGRPIFVEDYAVQVQARPEFVEWGVRSAAFVPLTSRTGERLVMLAARQAQLGWAPGQRRVLQAAARAMAIAGERAEHLRELQFAALHDKLTGLGNRRSFDADLEVAVSRAKRHGDAFGVMIIDLDGLKLLNDAEGHERGDALLREFAESLRVAFRNEDRIFRLGGDEYAVILERAVASHADVVLKRVRSAVALTRLASFPLMDASAGVAFFPDDALTGTSLARLADERMYAEKHDRRALREAAPESLPPA